MFGLGIEFGSELTRWPKFGPGSGSSGGFRRHREVSKINRFEFFNLVLQTRGLTVTENSRVGAECGPVNSAPGHHLSR
jgi:hypothetical protein